MRDTFMKAGQSLMVRKQLGNEKSLKEQELYIKSDRSQICKE
jgi:hypothetical protein